MKYLASILALCALLITVAPSNLSATEDLAAKAEACQGPPAFPGAEGWGKCATGWRGGQVIKVTNVNDTGAGSLRACLETVGPRVCMFETGGTIEVNNPLTISSGAQNAGGNVYVAGQSAPADSGGIQVKLAAVNASAQTFRVLESDHILLRHISLRPGPGQVSTASVSAFQCRNCEYLFLDHISMMFATDQNLSVASEKFTGLDPKRGISRFMTIQDSIIAWGLHNSNHPEGDHSKGALICSIGFGDFAAGDRCGYITMIRTLIAHNNDRNPEFSSTGEPIELINNIVYNPASAYFEASNVHTDTPYNLISNAVFEGPNTRDSAPVPRFVDCDILNPAVRCLLYLYGNIDEDTRPVSTAGTEISVVEDLTNVILQAGPNEHSAGAVIQAEDLTDIILPNVGATKPFRDELDARVAGDVVPNTGNRIDATTELTGGGLVGGYPVLAAGTPPTDTDGDGMPDDWETALDGSSFFVTRSNPWGDRNSDGWSNLEEYLSFLAGDIADPRT